MTLLLLIVAILGAYVGVPAALALLVAAGRRIWRTVAP